MTRREASARLRYLFTRVADGRSGREGTVRARAALAIVFGLVLIAAGVAYIASTNATGTVSIQVSDSPVAWSQVVVTFSEVSVLPSGAASSTGWISLPLQTQQVDLLGLGNTSRPLALDRVSPGTYVSVRVVVSAAYGVMLSGDPVVMSVSGGILEAGATFLVRGGATTTVTVDLNLAQSISETNTGWVFSPVLGPTKVG